MSETVSDGRTLIARAPLRISLAGGGTDLPAYYEKHGGMVVSTTIDKYVYVHCSPNGIGTSHDVQITSANYHTFYRHNHGMPMGWDGDLSLPRAVLHTFGIERDLSLFVASEVPPGTGLGSSSAIAVALAGAVAAFLRRPLSRRQVAELACQIELGKLHAPIGKQDQFAAAFGGCNAITFAGEGVTVEPVAAPPLALRQLDRRLLLFFTGTSRDSAAILKDQQQISAQGKSPTIESLHRMKEIAMECRECLETGDLDGIGRLLNEGWLRKRALVSGITNSRIDQLYDVALLNGALGGKITGAGGGGFLLLYCHEEHQDRLTRAMEELGLRRMDFHFEPKGVTVTVVQWAQAQGFEIVRPDDEEVAGVSPDVQGAGAGLDLSAGIGAAGTE